MGVLMSAPLASYVGPQVAQVFGYASSHAVPQAAALFSLIGGMTTGGVAAGAFTAAEGAAAAGLLAAIPGSIAGCAIVLILTILWPRPGGGPDESPTMIWLRRRLETGDSNHEEDPIRDQPEVNVEMTEVREESRRPAQWQEDLQSLLKKAEAKGRSVPTATVLPSKAEFDRALLRLDYQEGKFHFAVAGAAGSGKSSLINALRGLRNGQDGAAPTGSTETTLEIGRYPDSNPDTPFVWYDIPGAGTLTVPAAQYFNDQGLYIFDCIIVVIGERITEIDIAIMQNASLYNIPTYIVRPKSLQRIENTIQDIAEDSDDEDEEKRGVLIQRARKTYVTTARDSIKHNLLIAQLPEQRVYLVDTKNYLKLYARKPAPDVIDELEFVRDLMLDTHVRRIRAPEFQARLREVLRILTVD
ncbi:uncharacterized protein LAESUDRAFT_576400 [Laetiporus sulphureus 93-53]|uniref:IRG-type G domain-containing protein n=1 Tax=Laetiporus sulphureus 93-53 TaxID=1314785 RepID=A0A165B1C8_9APHY|nr:uncharacterized protein LAESUDRAFT_576400 [Laetiporus sulphureus 93-53]KZT00044.1 hypothetical protein LAESUDRAFT_576400 [Laetiporus sulphureus 93-53]